jgi:hypothetical protein
MPLRPGDPHGVFPEDARSLFGEASQPQGSSVFGRLSDPGTRMGCSPKTRGVSHEGLLGDGVALRWATTNLGDFERFSLIGRQQTSLWLRREYSA